MAVTTRIALISACLVPLAATAAAAAPAPPAKATTEASPHDRLFNLFKRSDEDTLRRNPMQAIYRGDLRYADRLGDLYSPEHFAGERIAAQRDLAELQTIDRAQLGATDQIAYDVFAYQTKDTLRGLQPTLLEPRIVRPMNHFFGLQTEYATFASGKGGAPFNTVADYENSLKRNRDFVRNVNEAIAMWRRGQDEGIVDTKLTVRNMIEQLDGQLKLSPEDSPYFEPVKNFPATVRPADRVRLAQAYRQSIATEIYPALGRLRDFLQNQYLPHAREGVGLMYMKGGDALYRYQVQSTTTLPKTPQEIHQLGLSEVARIIKGFEDVQKEVGFSGTLQQFFDYMRTSPKFQPKSRESLTQDFYRIKKAVEAKVPQFFSTVPKTKLVIRPYDPFREKFEAGGSYEQGSADGSRPGTFNFNAYDLPTRSTWGETTLFLHEGEPGHHFQISLAQEDEKLPSFMRFGGNTAYVEGWALYSETLGYDMGFYKDPYARFGTLNDEMLRAMRLVVDTGIHTKGWTREQAIDYMLSHSGMGKTDATAEVERYIAIPSQATAYKVGALTIQRLRKRAETELGRKFDIREFHAQVLGTGALPLAILEQKIDRWIAEKRSS
ncbi:uncharacterized protein (DUF885 family) [Sphingomonas sp. F9_3S_D5_B_2]